MLSRSQRIILSFGIVVCIVATMLFICSAQRLVSETLVRRDAVKNLSDRFAIYASIKESENISPKIFGYSTFSEDALQVIEKTFSNEFNFCPVSEAGHNMTELMIGTEADLETIVLGSNADFQTVSGLAMEEGSFFTDEQVAAKEKVCIVSNAVLNYFGVKKSDAVVMINGEQYKVTGVFSLPPILGNTSPIFRYAQDNERLILLPYNAKPFYINNDLQISYIFAKPKEKMNAAEISAYTSDITKRLKKSENENISLNRFSALPFYKIYQTDSISLGSVIMAISALSAVLLVLSGLNIVQLAKAAVYNNRRQIAIKMAVGASAFVICKELFSELAVLCVKASYFGISATAVCAAALNSFEGQRIFAFSISSILVALFGIACMLCFSVLVPFISIVKLPVAQELGTQREGA